MPLAIATGITINAGGELRTCLCYLLQHSESEQGQAWVRLATHTFSSHPSSSPDRPHQSGLNPAPVARSLAKVGEPDPGPEVKVPAPTAGLFELYISSCL